MVLTLLSAFLMSVEGLALPASKDLQMFFDVVFIFDGSLCRPVYIWPKESLLRQEWLRSLLYLVI